MGLENHYHFQNKLKLNLVVNISVNIVSFVTFSSKESKASQNMTLQFILIFLKYQGMEALSYYMTSSPRFVEKTNRD